MEPEYLFWETESDSVAEMAVEKILSEYLRIVDENSKKIKLQE